MKKILLGLLFLSRIVLADQAQGFAYSGTLVDSGGNAIAGPVAIGSQILAPNGCVLYQQNDAAVSTVAGNFSIQIGSPPGSVHRADNLGSTMAQIFANSGTIPSSTCPSGYVPSAGDQRSLHISIDQGPGPIPLSPDLVISSVPSALVAETLQGLTPSDLRIAPVLVSLESGSGTYPVPTGVLYFKIKMVGGGAGGLGSGTGNRSVGVTGGGNTTFGTLAANGGNASIDFGSTGGIGGTASKGSFAGIAVKGGDGGGQSVIPSTGIGLSGADGGSSALGGAGGGGSVGQTGGPGATNSGGGGGSGGNGGELPFSGVGGGGGSGGYVETMITNPLPSYNFQVGTGGLGAAPGNSGNAGGPGGSGVIYLELHYQ